MIYNQKKIQHSHQPQRAESSKSNSIPSIVDIRITAQDSIKQNDGSLSHVRCRTSFINRPIRQQRMTQLFQSVYDKIEQPKSQSRKTRTFVTEQLKDMTKKQSQVLPTTIVDTLYRQNIKNYNAFTATLQALEEEASLSSITKQRISKLCHIGAAKQFLKAKKYSEKPTYSRVNIQIRPYMREKMYEQMKYKQQKYQNVVFIPTNQLALSFDPYSCPKQLEESVQPQMFTSTIKHVNSIIEQEYVSYKASSIRMFTQSLMARMALALIALLVFIYLLNPAKEILGIIFGVILVWVLLSIHQCSEKLQELVRSKNVTNTILQKITSYFQKVSTEQTQWRVGDDFYWLQIHFIKKKKCYKLK